MLAIRIGKIRIMDSPERMAWWAIRRRHCVIRCVIFGSLIWLQSFNRIKMHCRRTARPLIKRQERTTYTFRTQNYPQLTFQLKFSGITLASLNVKMKNRHANLLQAQLGLVGRGYVAYRCNSFAILFVRMTAACVDTARIRERHSIFETWRGWVESSISEAKRDLPCNELFDRLANETILEIEYDCASIKFCRNKTTIVPWYKILI